MPIATGTEDPGSISLVRVFFGVENTGLRQIEVVNLSILGVDVEDRVPEHSNRFNGIDVLPEHMTGIVIATDTIAGNRSQLEHRLRTVNDKARMHFDGDLHPVIFSELAVLNPIRSDFLLPL